MTGRGETRERVVGGGGVQNRFGEGFYGMSSPRPSFPTPICCSLTNFHDVRAIRANRLKPAIRIF